MQMWSSRAGGSVGSSSRCSAPSPQYIGSPSSSSLAPAAPTLLPRRRPLTHLPRHRRPLHFFLAAGPFLFFLGTGGPYSSSSPPAPSSSSSAPTAPSLPRPPASSSSFSAPTAPSLPRPPASSSSFSAPTPLRHAPRPHAAPSAASFSVCSTSPCPRCGSASRPSPQATRRGAASSGVRREGVNLRREKEQWREGRVQFNSIQQCHIHPNGCFHIRTHFNTWPDLVLGSIQYQASQYQHPNAALLICGAHMSQ